MHRPSLFLVTAALIALSGCSAGASSASPSPSHSCVSVTEDEVAALFDRWNDSLATKDPAKVVDNYAEKSFLLPTLSNTPRDTREEKEDYFEHFLKNEPTGVVDERFIDIDCDSALDTGLYTFTYGTTGKKVKARYTFTYEYIDGDWKITSHHSSQMPEG